MSRVDRILDVLDNTGQDSHECGFGDYDRTCCWRCEGPAGDGASGVCDDCREVLLAEIPDTERGVAEFEISAVVDRIGALLTEMQASPAWRYVIDHMAEYQPAPEAVSDETTFTIYDEVADWSGWRQRWIAGMSPEQQAIAGEWLAFGSAQFIVSERMQSEIRDSAALARMQAVCGPEQFDEALNEVDRLMTCPFPGDRRLSRTEALEAVTATIVAGLPLGRAGAVAEHGIDIVRQLDTHWNERARSMQDAINEAVMRIAVAADDPRYLIDEWTAPDDPPTPDPDGRV